MSCNADRCSSINKIDDTVASGVSYSFFARILELGFVDNGGGGNGGSSGGDSGGSGEGDDGGSGGGGGGSGSAVSLLVLLLGVTATGLILLRFELDLMPKKKRRPGKQLQPQLTMMMLYRQCQYREGGKKTYGALLMTALL